MAQPPLSIAIVGCNIGKAQATAFASLKEQYTLAAFCDQDLRRANEAAAEFGVSRTYQHFEDLCRDPGIDIISLCTPPTLHFRQILHALSAGKHVIAEKPLVGSLREVDELARAERESRGRLMPILQARFGRGLQKLRHLVQSGVAGRCYAGSCETAWSRGSHYYSVPWRSQRLESLGGCLLQQGIHAHDAYCHVVGRPKRVFALAATRVNAIETEDCASVCLEMEDGSVASWLVTLGAAVETTRHRFFFEHLTAESNDSAYQNTSEPWKFLPRSDAAREAIDQALRGFDSGLEGYAGQFLRLHAALQQGGPLPVTIGDARQAIELATALYRSLSTGLRVELPLSPEDPDYAGWQPKALQSAATGA